MNSYSSRLLETAVNELSRLPGIGKRTALRLAMHLLREEPQTAEAIGNAIIKLRKEVGYCRRCNNISDSEICAICSDPDRDSSMVCVVEDIRDVMAIESTGRFKGLYHVLGGRISPMDGIGPDDLTIAHLIERVKQESVSEIFLALSSTIEGDTTNFYLYKLLKGTGIRITTIARGISVGDELEYADEVTLGRSIINRILYESTLEG